MLAQTVVDPLSLEPYITLISNAGGVGLLIILLLSRRLVTRGEYEEMKSDRDLQREINQVERDRNDRLEKVNSTLIDQSETIIHLIESITQGPSAKRKKDPA